MSFASPEEAFAWNMKLAGACQLELSSGVTIETVGGLVLVGDDQGARAAGGLRALAVGCHRGERCERPAAGLGQAEGPGCRGDGAGERAVQEELDLLQDVVQLRAHGVRRERDARGIQVAARCLRGPRLTVGGCIRAATVTFLGAEVVSAPLLSTALAVMA